MGRHIPCDGHGMDTVAASQPHAGALAPTHTRRRHGPLSTRRVPPSARLQARVEAASIGNAAIVPDEDDAALVARCLCGDSAAWSVLVRRYQRLVYAIVCRSGLDEHGAADVFQTVFTRLLQHLPRLIDPSRLQAWIVTTAKREALLQRRTGQRYLSMSCADDAPDASPEWDVADESPIAEEMLSNQQQLHLLRLALDRLDARSRSLLLLLFRDGDEKLSYGEVAHRQGLAVGSIGPTRSRCLERLRTLMKSASAPVHSVEHC